MTETARAAAPAKRPAAILNFDEVQCEIVRVSKRGRTFDLRDDIPFHVVAQVFALGNLGSRMVDAADEAKRLAAEEGNVMDAGQLVADAIAETDDQVIPLVLDIFRWTYPDTTEEEIVDLFSFEERQQILRLFFTRRLASSSALPAATPAATAGSPEQERRQEPEAEAAPMPTLNRATRRTLARHSTASRLGTTPRQSR